MRADSGNRVAYLRPSRRWGGAVLLASVLGCVQDPPFARTGMHVQTEAEARQRWILDKAQQRRVLAALDAVAEGEPVVARPRPALLGVRFEDVPRAAGTAADSVEMAVVRHRALKEGILFEMRFAPPPGTLEIEDRLATMTVLRTGDQRVYEVESIPGDPADALRIAALVEAFHDAMRRFGLKRRFEEEGG